MEKNHPPSPQKKYTVQDSFIEANKVHIGDIIYQNTSPSEVQLSKELETLKSKLSILKRKVLEESKTTGTPLEISTLKLLKKMSEQEAQAVVILYQKIVLKPWRDAISFYDELEKLIPEMVNDSEILKVLNINLMPSNSLAIKLRACISLFPMISSHENFSLNKQLANLWQDCLLLTKKNN